MSRLDTSQPFWMLPERSSFDDAYSAWFNAQSRCTEALRAWQAAALDERAAAYAVYLTELQLEEAAAGELERVHSR